MRGPSEAFLAHCSDLSEVRQATGANFVASGILSFGFYVFSLVVLVHFVLFVLFCSTRN